jgi:hypothetical protein
MRSAAGMVPPASGGLRGALLLSGTAVDDMAAEHHVWVECRTYSSFVQHILLYVSTFSVQEA